VGFLQLAHTFPLARDPFFDALRLNRPCQVSLVRAPHDSLEIYTHPPQIFCMKNFHIYKVVQPPPPCHGIYPTQRLDESLHVLKPCLLGNSQCHSRDDYLRTIFGPAFGGQICHAEVIMKTRTFPMADRFRLLQAITRCLHVVESSAANRWSLHNPPHTSTSVVVKCHEPTQ
jgi:hypothetical protein